MIYTDRVIDCDVHGQQVVVLADGRNGQLLDRCVKCVRDRIASDGFCACECGQRLGGRVETSKYLGQKHRQAAHRADLRALAVALGVNASLSVKTVRAASTTASRRSDDERAGRVATRRNAKRKPDLRVSYRKAVEAVEQALADGVFEYSRIRSTREQVEAVLGGLLTDRQRAAL